MCAGVRLNVYSACEDEVLFTYIKTDQRITNLTIPETHTG
jgi:hypothetical protein